MKPFCPSSRAAPRPVITLTAGAALSQPPEAADREWTCAMEDRVTKCRPSADFPSRVPPLWRLWFGDRRRKRQCISQRML